MDGSRVNPPPETPALRLEGIGRTFRVGDRPVHALVDVDTSVAAGEHLAIMGPSGSGKSTLLNILGCLDRPTAGRYELAGQAVSELDDDALTAIRRHEIGFVFQFFHLVPRLTAAENVELPMIFAGVARRDRRPRVAAALEAVDLVDRAEHKPDQLSGGERQRVALARATVMGPKILLADEPTGNLDTRSGEVVLELLESLNRAGLTLVVVTHNPYVAQRADRILVLVDGRLALEAGPAQIDRVMALLAAGEAPAGDAADAAPSPATGARAPR